jgi:predicted porin
MTQFNKTLLAGMACLACLSANAQSSVTLFGVAEAQVGSWRNLSAAPVSSSNLFGATSTSASTTGMPSYGVNASRIGLRGVEDLGGGMKATFVLENQLALDNGTTPARFFHRQSNVALSGNFGQVKLGRIYSAWNDIASNGAPGYGDSYDPYVRIWHAGGPVPLGSPTPTADGKVTGLAGAMGTNNDVGHPENWSHVRIDKSVRYDSPKLFNAVVLSAQVGLGGGTSQPSSQSFAALYESGRIRTGIGYFGQNTKSTYDMATGQSNALKAKTGKMETITAAFNYDFGPAKLVSMAGQSKYDLFSLGKKVTSTEWSVGVIAPYQKWIFKASVAGSDSKQLAGKDSGFGAEIHYNISKRTAVYGAYSTAKHDELLNGQNYRKSDLTAIGLRHFF